MESQAIVSEDTRLCLLDEVKNGTITGGEAILVRDFIKALEWAENEILLLRLAMDTGITK